MVITLAGHVDHGKTAIVKALTEVNTDRLEEEQKRGLTIELGFAYTLLGEHRVGFVDVPGHHRFIHNMIAGVANMQHALLVIAADDGVMPQTTEHLNILDLLGVAEGTIVLNKIDKVTDERVAEIQQEIRQTVAGTFLHNAPIIPTSAETGAGLATLKDVLTDRAQHFQFTQRDQPFRLAIDRSFSLSGVGTVVTGTAISGSLRVGERLRLSRTGDVARVRSIKVQDKETLEAVPGDRCGINIVGPTAEDSRRGDWLMNPDRLMPVRSTIIELTVLRDFARAVRNHSPVHVYHLSSHCQARIQFFDTTKLPPGEKVLAILHCRNPMHFKIGDRIILRDQDLFQTLGGATIVEVFQQSPSKRQLKQKFSRSQKLAAAISTHNPIETLTIQCQDELVDIEHFCNSWNIYPSVLDCSLADIIKSQDALLHTTHYKDVEEALKQYLLIYHQENPSRQGAGLHELKSVIRFEPNAIEYVLRTNVFRIFKQVHGLHALREHEVAMEQIDPAMFESLKGLIDLPHPCSTGDIAKRLRLPLTTIHRELRKMESMGLFVKVHDNRYFVPKRLRELANLARRLALEGDFTVRQYRDASELGRNVAIDVLEYFDKQQLTRRLDDKRTTTQKIDAFVSNS